MIRIGYGYDIHRLETGRRLLLGGVLIQSDLGAIAHSDGDVLLHSICDALLGAAALGDIGTHFPDSDPQYKDISSIKLLIKTNTLLRRGGYSVVNIDSTILLERPKIMSYVDSMRKNISSALSIDHNLISIKATTSEGLGCIGSRAGIAAHCVAFIQSIK